MWLKSKNLMKDDRWWENLLYTGSFLGVWLASACGALLLCSISLIVQSPTREGLTNGLALFCHGSLLSLAFGSIGGLVGFLFGIPRQVRQSNRNADKTGDGKAAHDEVPPDATNLEQISDWLTKIILGAGLTQLVRVGPVLNSLGERFKGDFNGSSLLPILIVINSLIFGFFAGYLLTQLFLAQALKKAQDALKSATEAIETVVGAAAEVAKLEQLIADLPTGTSPQLKRNLFEQLTNHALYLPPSDGYQKVIRYADQYIQEEPNNPSARIWANLAAALGQKYKYDKEVNKRPQQELDETRKRALEAATRAIELQPEMKSWLRTLWNPEDPVKERTLEDDLEIFYTDEEFKKLLGS